MLSTFSVSLPIFALIAAGYLCRKANVLGITAASELNRFVVYLALPALLFNTMAAAHWKDLYEPGFVGAFLIGAAVVFGASLVIRLGSKREFADAAIDSLNASYANVGFMGFSLSVMVFGNDGLPPAVIATIITVCILFAATIVMIEFSLQEQKQPLKALAKVGRSLSKNPLLLAPVLGALCSGMHVAVPAVLSTVLKLVGSAASPCALVSLGAFLASKQTGKADGGAAWLVGCKLVVQPVVTWLLAFHVFAMPTMWARAAVLLAALPTGTGPYMLAELYQRRASITSSVILASTVGSILTIALCLAWFAR